MLLVVPARAAHAETVRVSVLGLRSFAARPEDLAAVSEEISLRLKAEQGLTLVDPVRPLVDRGSDRWLEADHLLFEGIELYGELRYDDAVERLKKALAISESTFREYADLQGPRRVRDTCLYLGLARLEQGAGDDAAAWFRRAARVDPGYVLDAKLFSPAARDAWTEARKELSGPPMETSLERLGPMADAIGADVVVTGGVNAREGGGAALQLVIADRRRGLLTEQSVNARAMARPDLVNAVDAVIPQVVARILDRPVFDDRAIARRVRVYAGGEWAERLDATLRGDAITDHYQWRGALPLRGVALGATGLRAGAVAIVPGLSFYPAQTLPRKFRSSPVSSTLELGLGLAARVYAVWELRRGSTVLGAGPGVEADYLLLTFRSQSSLAPTAKSWIAPAAVLTLRRELGRSLAVDVQAGTALGLGPTPGRAGWRIQAAIGTAF